MVCRLLRSIGRQAFSVLKPSRGVVVSCQLARVLCATNFGNQNVRQFGIMSRERTFAYDEQLPPLNVPDLDNTLEKYLDSVRAVASDEEYERTKKSCEQFLQNQAPRLQEYLKEWEKTHKNWVEKWWLEKGYLELRMPLQYMNFTGTPSYIDQFWPPKDGTQVERVAMGIHLLAQFHYLLRNEKIEVHRSNSGAIFAMDQFRTAYNTCQTPHKGRDRLDCYFKTVQEGETPLHIVVLCKGHLFKLNIYSPRHGRPYNPPQLEKAVNTIRDICARKNVAPGVAALTSLPRDQWADVRQHLMSLAPGNKTNLETIETAIGVFSLDDNRSDNYTDALFNVMTGDASQRWRDKSYNEVWSRNGTMATSCAHSALDGMVMVMYMEYTTFMLKRFKGVWSGSKDTDEISEIKELDFVADQKIEYAIQQGKDASAKFAEDLWLQSSCFPYFGKKAMKKLKIFPDAFVQTSLQLAYMRMHGKPASTYETATTRQFYHGRTETCRTCTPELVAFCRAVIESNDNRDPKACSLLKKCLEKFAYLMDECRNNRGCDRHLFGLAVAAQETGTPLPELFVDPMFSKSGGGGNFVLSTSFVGFFNSSGVVAPMLDDGYGVFYRIVDDKIFLTMTSWRYSNETNLHTFYGQVERALRDVYEMHEHMNEARL